MVEEGKILESNLSNTIQGVNRYADILSNWWFLFLRAFYCRDDICEALDVDADTWRYWINRHLLLFDAYRFINTARDAKKEYRRRSLAFREGL